MKKMSKKCSTCVQLNRVAYIIGITCYKIGTLVSNWASCNGTEITESRHTESSMY